MKCIIIGAGDFNSVDFKHTAEDFIIAADGGYKYLLDIGCIPDIVIGDFDSLGCVPEHPAVIRLNAVKDETDMAAAMNIAYERGYREFYVYGAAGGRIDHTIANIQLLANLSKLMCNVYIFSENQIITAITDNTKYFDTTHKGYISVFAYDTSVTGVTLKGLKYPLNDATITNRFPIGISNEFIGEDSSITVKNGTLLIVYSNWQ